MTPDARVATLDHRGEYGFDGNILGVVAMTAGGISLVVLAVVLARAAHGRAAASALIGAALLFSTLGIYAHTTQRGKFAVWAELLDTLRLRGDERILDVGCGRGAVMTMVAKLLPIDEIARVLMPSGRVVIADLAWTRAYARQLEDRGFADVRRQRLGWRFWWGLAFPATSVVLGRHQPGK